MSDKLFPFSKTQIKHNFWSLLPYTQQTEEVSLTLSHTPQLKKKISNKFMKKFKHTTKLKEFYSVYLHTYYPDSTNIFINLLPWCYNWYIYYNWWTNIDTLLTKVHSLW